MVTPTYISTVDLVCGTTLICIGSFSGQTLCVETSLSAHFMSACSFARGLQSIDRI